MTKPYVRNSADEKQTKAAETKENLRRRRELDDVRTVLSIPEGRRFVWRYLQRCGVFKSSFTGSFETYFLEGERNIGLLLFTDVQESSPESYLKMLEEEKLENGE